MTPSLRIFEAGPAGPLDIQGIERDLAMLWKEASTAGREPAMRASRANLIVVLEGIDPAQRGRTRLEECVPLIARSYPARLIVVSSEPDAQPETLNASVSALCALAGGARYVCCERINLGVGRGGEQAIPGTTLALLIGAIPVVVWTPGEPPFAASWFRTLAASADRLMIDSSLFSAPAAAFRALDHLEIPLADFEWPRLVPWRAAIASAFDSEEGRRAVHEGLGRVTFHERPRPVAGGSSSGATSRQTVMADESRPAERASSASLLLRAWLMKRARIQTFVWSGADEIPPPLPAAQPSSGPMSSACLWDTEPSRGIVWIQFEGLAPGRLKLVVHAPTLGRPLKASDFAELIGGQRDNPMGSSSPQVAAR